MKSCCGMRPERPFCDRVRTSSDRKEEICGGIWPRRAGFDRRLSCRSDELKILNVETEREVSV